MDIKAIAVMEGVVIGGLLKLIENEGVDINSVNLSINYGNGTQSPDTKLVDIIGFLQEQYEDLKSGDWVLVPKEKIESLVDELHVAFQSNPPMSLGELHPLLHDFQLMIEAAQGEEE